MGEWKWMRLCVRVGERRAAHPSDSSVCVCAVRSAHEAAASTSAPEQNRVERFPVRELIDQRQRRKNDSAASLETKQTSDDRVATRHVTRHSLRPRPGAQFQTQFRFKLGNRCTRIPLRSTIAFRVSIIFFFSCHLSKTNMSDKRQAKQIMIFSTT